jgi:ATP-binding cassette subfamily B protein
LLAILLWGQNHFVVLTPKAKSNKLQVADPAKGMVTFNREAYLAQWIGTHHLGTAKSIALMLERFTDGIKGWRSH